MENHNFHLYYYGEVGRKNQDEILTKMKKYEAFILIEFEQSTVSSGQISSAFPCTAGKQYENRDYFKPACQHIRLHDTGLTQRCHGGTVSVDSDDIVRSMLDFSTELLESMRVRL